jgi:hypothetical protein
MTGSRFPGESEKQKKRKIAIRLEAARETRGRAAANKDGLAGYGIDSAYTISNTPNGGTPHKLWLTTTWMLVAFIIKCDESPDGTWAPSNPVLENILSYRCNSANGALKTLVKKGYLIKHDRTINGKSVFSCEDLEGLKEKYSYVISLAKKRMEENGGIMGKCPNASIVKDVFAEFMSSKNQPNKNVKAFRAPFNHVTEKAQQEKNVNVSKYIMKKYPPKDIILISGRANLIKYVPLSNPKPGKYKYEDIANYVVSVDTSNDQGDFSVNNPELNPFGIITLQEAFKNDQGMQAIAVKLNSATSEEEVEQILDTTHRGLGQVGRPNKVRKRFVKLLRQLCRNNGYSTTTMDLDAMEARERYTRRRAEGRVPKQRKKNLITSIEEVLNEHGVDYPTKEHIKIQLHKLVKKEGPGYLRELLQKARENSYIMGESVKDILAYIMKKDVREKLITTGRIGLKLVISAVSLNPISESTTTEQIMQRSTPNNNIKPSEHYLDEIERSDAPQIIKDIRKKAVTKLGSAHYYEYERNVQFRLDHKTIGTDDEIEIYVVGSRFVVDKVIQETRTYDIIPRGVWLIPHYNDLLAVSW